jgi:hypothetical protein
MEIRWRGQYWTPPFFNESCAKSRGVIGSMSLREREGKSLRLEGIRRENAAVSSW